MVIGVGIEDEGRLIPAAASGSASDALASTMAEL
jgi:hypothetical protein